jgi:shikimate dehydrogenase
MTARHDITGHTKLLGIIAHPVVHVLTPTLFNRFFAARGIDAVLVGFEVPPARLADALQGFRGLSNLAGFVATMPHKGAMVALCDEVSPAGRRIGAVNTIRRTPDGRLIGTMFDGDGFVAGLRAKGHEPRGRRALLAGAGGAASAIAFALAGAGVAQLTIHNRTAAKARDLAGRLRAAHPAVAVTVAAGAADPRGHDLIVNGTSLGMHPGDALPVVVDGLSSDMVVAEVIMAPETTPLLAAAAARGCPVHLGRHMLEEQIAIMAEYIGV